MFVLHMPITFKLGDTADCMINRQPAKVTWRDAKTLVINGTDARVIYESVQVENAAGEVMTCFTCGNEGGVGDDRGVTIIRPRVRR